MAIMVPASIEYLEGATFGEKRLFRILRSVLPDDYYVWYDHPVMERYPDFIILGPNLGITILEVKDWELDSIIDMDNENVELRSTGRKAPNPYRQARIYMRALLDLLGKNRALKEQEGKYKGSLKFNWGYGAVLTRIDEKNWANKKYANAIQPQHLIFKTDLDLIESTKETKYLLRRLKGMDHTSIQYTALSGEDMDLIIKIISQKLFDRYQKPKEEEPPISPGPNKLAPPELVPSSQAQKKSRMPVMLATSAIIISVLAVFIFVKPDLFKKESKEKPSIDISQLPARAFKSDTPIVTAPAVTKPLSSQGLRQRDADKVIVLEKIIPATIKGNISKSGEKIYHVPGQRYYDVTNPEQWFRTEQEAIQAGFRKAKDIWIKGNINQRGEKIYHMPGQEFYDKTMAEEWFKTEKDALNADYRKSK